MKQLGKLIAFTFLSICMTSSCFSQEKKIKTVLYFLADTIDVDKASQVLEIGEEGRLKYYAFFCRCIPPYQLYCVFNYKTNRVTPEVSNKMPVGKYLTWKELSDLFWKHGNGFTEAYQLIIVEKLPENRYQINNELEWMVHKPLERLD